VPFSNFKVQRYSEVFKPIQFKMDGHLFSVVLTSKVYHNFRSFAIVS
jgi:hypothetical protein